MVPNAPELSDFLIILNVVARTPAGFDGIWNLGEVVRPKDDRKCCLDRCLLFRLHKFGRRDDETTEACALSSMADL